MSPALPPKGISAPSAPGSQRAGDQIGDALEYRVGIERRRIDDSSIGRRDQRSGPTLDVTRVAFLQILQDVLQYNCGALLPQLFEPTPDALRCAGRDEQLYLGRRADERPDIAAVEDRTLGRRWRMRGEIPLQV